MTHSDIGAEVGKAWPWTSGFLRHLHQVRATPFRGSHLLFGSDYSGDHPASRFKVYAFVIADADGSPEWPARCRDVRLRFLRDGRRMAFKNLNDGHRRRALIPFLEAAEHLDGHVVAVAVTKQLARLSTTAGIRDLWASLHGLQARWDEAAFEQMARVAHFFSLFLAAWSTPGVHVSWLTDDDTIVANADRLEDAHDLAARLCDLCVPHRLGEFMMNTVALDTGDRQLEDFVSIPDLAAGMLTEAMSGEAETPLVGRLQSVRQKQLSPKADTIADWFWYGAGSLKKTCIVVERADAGNFGIGELQLG